MRTRNSPARPSRRRCRRAREEFGAELNDLDFEILTPGSRGVLGMGAEPARIVAAPRRRSVAPRRSATPPRPRRFRRRHASAFATGATATADGGRDAARAATTGLATTDHAAPAEDRGGLDVTDRPPRTTGPATTGRAAIDPGAMTAGRPATDPATTARRAATSAAAQAAAR